jgi:hypothetical protein
MNEISEDFSVVLIKAKGASERIYLSINPTSI